MCYASTRRSCFCFNGPAPTEIYTLSLHDALPIFCTAVVVWRIGSSVSGSTPTAIVSTELRAGPRAAPPVPGARSEEHTSELQSQSNLVCRLLLEKKNTRTARQPETPFDN